MNIFKNLKYVFNPTYEITIRCAWCSVPVTRKMAIGSPQPQYCGPTHRKRASEARKNRRQAQELKEVNLERSHPSNVPGPPAVCPTPDKKRYTDLIAAMRHIARVDPKMHAYVCRCGVIHVGHGRNL